MMKRNKQRKKGNKIIILFTIIIVCLAFYVIDKKLENGNTKFISIFGKSDLQAEDAIVDISEDTQIKYARIVAKATGVGPWDINDEPGNDNSASNDIVRSFDQVTWTINFGWGEQNSDSTKVYNRGTIYVKAILPDENKAYMEWDTSSMGWANNASVKNGVFTACYELPSDQCKASGSQDLYFVLKVLGAPNRLPITPIFYGSLKENAEESSVGLDANASSEALNSIVKVSAAPRLNVGLYRNGNLNYKSYFDWKNGIESVTKTSNAENQIYYGRMLGYGINVQLYNPKFIDSNGVEREGKDKALKGIAIPNGDITFDISFKEQKSETGAILDANPIIWDLQENATRTLSEAKTLKGKMNKNLYWNNMRETTFSPSAPANKKGGDGNYARNSCYNGGNWQIENCTSPGERAFIKISNYAIDGKTFPYQNIGQMQSTVNHKDNVGCISSGYIQTIMQIPENVGSLTHIYMIAKINNIQFNTLEYVDGQLQSKQTIYENTTENSDIVSKDNERGESITIRPKGEYDKWQWFQKENSTSISIGSINRLENTNSGRAKLAKGNSFFSCVEALESSTNDERFKSVSILQKFDDRAFEPNVEKMADIKCDADKSYLKVLYAAMPNGKGWLGNLDETAVSELTEEEKDQIVSNNMETTREEDLIYFTSYEELKSQGYTCVAILYEYKNNIARVGRAVTCAIKMKVKNEDTVVIGRTYQVIDDVRFWIAEDDAEFSWANEKDNAIIDEINNTVTYEGIEERYPAPTKKLYNTAGSKSYPLYVKTEYDENMQITPNSNLEGLNSGNSLLILGANLSVGKNNTKVEAGGSPNYDIGKEQEVEYIIKPRLENDALDDSAKIEGVTLWVTETLPDGLTYAGETSKTPYDVSTDRRTIIWKIEDVSVNDAITPITYKAKIYEESEDGQEYETTTVIHADERDLAKIGNTNVVDRTATDTIKIVNVSGSGFYKTTEQQIIEKNGEINYHLVLTNVTASSLEKYQLLDILPYSNDDRGSKFSGNYKVSNITINQIDNKNNTIANDNLTLYVSCKEAARNAKAIDTFSEGAVWEEYEEGKIYEGCTAFVIKGTWQDKTRVEIDLTVKTQGNNAGDIYANSYSTGIRGENDDTAILPSNLVTTHVVSRKIAGFAWLDIDTNGLYDPEKETKLQGIEVTLLDADTNAVAKDENGSNIAPVLTDENGLYSFNDLKRGNYKVQFKYNGTEDYKITKTKQGGDTQTAINNKATGENKEGTTDIIDMDNINNAVMEENYINVGYKKPYKYTIDYVEKDNESHVLKHVDGAEEYGTDIAIGEESFTGYVLVENQTVPEKITITDNEESNSIKIYYEKATYKITYKIEGEYFTNEKYAEEEYKYEEEVTAKAAPNKTGYTFSGWSEIPNTMPAHDVEVKGHYTANGNTAYKVEHYIEDLDGEYTLKDTENLTGTTGAKVQYSEKEYEGYTYDASKTENGEASIESDGDTVVKLYYTRNKYQYTIKHVEKGKESNVLEEEKAEAAYGTEIEVKSKEYEGYTYDSKDKDKIEITVNSNNNIAIVKYNRNSYKITYKIEGEYFTNEKYAEEEYKYEEEVTAKESPNKAGYTFSGWSEIPNTMPAHDVEVKGHYTANGDTAYKVEHYIEDLNGEYILKDTESLTGTTGEKVQYSEKEYEGYTYDASKTENGEVSIAGEGDTVVKLYYTRNEGKIIIKYIDLNTREEIANQETQSGKIGEDYSVKKENIKEIEGYELIVESMPQNAEGKYTIDSMENPIVIIYYYKKKTKVIVKHIDKVSNTELDIETIEGLVGDVYTAESKNFENYVLIEKPEQEKVTMTDGVITIIYYYAPVSKGVIEKHINIGTDEVIYNEIHKGNQGDPYDIKSKQFEGYELVEDKLPQNAQGFMEEELIEVIYYYRYKTIIKIKYIDAETGEELEKDIIKEGYDGDTYKTEEKEIAGYELIEEPSNKEGNMTKDIIEIKYLYKKIETKQEEKDEDKPNKPSTSEIEKVTNATEKENSQLRDTTMAPGIIPQTGEKKVIISAIVAISIGSIILFTRIRKYKDI